MARRVLDELQEIVEFISYYSKARLEEGDSDNFTALVTLLVGGNLISGTLISYLAYTKKVLENDSYSDVMFGFPLDISNYISNPSKDTFSSYEKAVKEILQTDSEGATTLYMIDVSLFFNGRIVSLPTMSINVDKVEGWMPGKVTEFTS